MITEKLILEINDEISGQGVKSKSLVGSSLSSFHYYEDTSHQIISIIMGLIKNHPFVDGNKRTALTVLYYLSEQYKLELIDDNKLYNIIIEIATTKSSVEDFSSKIFR